MARPSHIVAVGVAAMLAACSAPHSELRVRPALSLGGVSIAGQGHNAYERGKKLLDERRFGAATAAFQAALFVDGPSVKRLNALAVSYDEMGRYDLSARYFEQALLLDPRNPQTLNNLAISFAKRGTPDRARKLLAEALLFDPHSKVVAANLAHVQAETGLSLATAAPLTMSTTQAAVPRVERTGPTRHQLITLNASGQGVPLQPAPKELLTGMPSAAVAGGTPESASAARVAEVQTVPPAVIRHALPPPAPSGFTAIIAKLPHGAPGVANVPERPGATKPAAMTAAVKSARGAGTPSAAAEKVERAGWHGANADAALEPVPAPAALAPNAEFRREGDLATRVPAVFGDDVLKFDRRPIGEGVHDES